MLETVLLSMAAGFPDVADKLNVDVIVMGTGGVSLNSDDGSTAARVIELAPCLVLVVP